MKTFLLGSFLFIMMLTSGQAQTTENADKDYRNFPLIVSIQFQNFALPFKDLGSNFSNVGSLSALK